MLAQYRGHGIRPSRGAARRPAVRAPSTPASSATRASSSRSSATRPATGSTSTSPAYPEYHPQSRSRRTRTSRTSSARSTPAPNSAITQYFFNADAYWSFVDPARGARRRACRSCRASCRSQLHPARALLRCVRRRDPALDPAQARKLRRRHGVDPRVRPRRRHRSVRRPARRRRAGPALLHAEPGRRRRPRSGSAWACRSAARHRAALS